jgi:hypothetical protein
MGPSWVLHPGRLGCEQGRLRFNKETIATMIVLLLALIGLFLLFVGMLGVAIYADHHKRRLPR